MKQKKSTKPKLVISKSKRIDKADGNLVGKVSKKLEVEIKQVMKIFWDSYFKGDLKRWTHLMRDDYRNIGTNEEEIWNSKKEVVDFTTKMLDQFAGKVTTKNKKTTIISYGELIMVHEFGDLYVKADAKLKFYSKVRLSSLLEKTGERWQILHQHGSYPDNRLQEGEFFAFDNLKSENAKLHKAIKGRTLELERKNRELEIEAALERVRAVAMGMRKPDDMLDVCQTIAQQLAFLNVREVRNVQTAIIDESKGIYINYEYYVKHDKLLTTEVDYNLHPEHASFVNKMLESPEAFYEQSFTGKELKDWYAYQKTTSQFADSYLQKAKSLNYYMHSVGGVVLGMSTYAPLSEEEIDLFKRFRNVFDLAYRRFEDIKKAEAQAREAQIESSLERVRSRSLAMHNTSELQEVIHTVHKELLQLNVSIHGGSFIAINNDITSVLRCWGSGGTADTSEEVKLPLYEKPFCTNLINRIKGTPGFFTEEYTQQEKRDFFTFLFKHEPWLNLNVDQKNETLASPGGYTRSCCVSEHTSIFIINHLGQKFSTTDNDILQRFSRVFEQTYTRFLDLQKAEAQTLETEIELALERVRARTMAMQNSDELLEASTLLFQQIESLGASSWNCSFNIWDEDRKHATAWNGTKDGFGRPFKTDSTEDVFLRFYEAAQRGEELYVEEIGGEKLKQHYNYLSTVPGVRDTLAELKAAGIALPDFQIFNIVYFSQGYLMFITYEPVPLLWDTFKRFAKVFEQTYTRFLDLQKAEAQALRAEHDLLEIKSARKKAEDALIELQATQKQLIQSEKMASLGELTAGIAHEIQNPLNFVNNFSEVSTELVDEMNAELAAGNLQPATEIARDIKQNLEKINHHGKRAGDIVKGMLQHSRTGSGQKELTDINALADEYLRLAYHGLKAKDKSFNAKFETNLDVNLPKVNVVPQDIGRVILNLINNAFYSVSEKSKQGIPAYEPIVTISTTLENESNSAIKGINEIIKITVKDNGNGIPDSIKEKIFQPFFTTKPTGQGTGLGLSLSYDIIKVHGGTIKAENQLGEGTLFIIQLPIT